eukprot:6047176-Prymnesium_polylepis.3
MIAMIAADLAADGLHAFSSADRLAFALAPLSRTGAAAPLFSGLPGDFDRGLRGRVPRLRGRRASEQVVAGLLRQGAGVAVTAPIRMVARHLDSLRSEA